MTIVYCTECKDFPQVPLKYGNKMLSSHISWCSVSKEKARKYEDIEMQDIKL